MATPPKTLLNDDLASFSLGFHDHQSKGKFKMLSVYQVDPMIIDMLGVKTPSSGCIQSFISVKLTLTDFLLWKL